jgi:SNF2 family DNA or RNA helicase
MKLSKFLVSSEDITFKHYLMADTLVKKIAIEFKFYNVHFYKQQYSTDFEIWLEYPHSNIYWYVDFENYIKFELLIKDVRYERQWLQLLHQLKEQIKQEASVLQKELDEISQKDILDAMYDYDLRDYQALDLLQLLAKMRHHTPRVGLILNEQRTGKTRVAIAAAAKLVPIGSTILVVGPKTSLISWKNEIEHMNQYWEKDSISINVDIVLKLSQLKDLNTTYRLDKYNFRLISYDLFKRATQSQYAQITSLKYTKNLVIIGDEVHRLRNFKTLQSTALFRFKDFCEEKGMLINILGLTGTPAVKESHDVFGLLSFINYSKIWFHPYYTHFNEFKEYFYICEDTSFGKVTLALKRADELNFLIKIHAVQTKQKKLALFKDYEKKYKKVVLPLDTKQKVMYNAVRDYMEYGTEIDAKNKLAQLVRLQQICVDPSVLVEDYTNIPPKAAYIIKLAKAYPDLPFIVMSKKLAIFGTLAKQFDLLGIKYSLVTGRVPLKDKQEEIKKFMNKETQVFLLQLDVGRESLTLPVAKLTVFADRDFAQGYNEQAEARMTPFDGIPQVKYVIDLVMEGTIEERIYDILVTKKQSIGDVNELWTSEKEVKYGV